MDIDRIFWATPEYRRLLSEGLTREDAMWHSYRYHAQERVDRTLDEVATARGIDLIFPVGAVRLKPDRPGMCIPDLTEQVLRALEPLTRQ